jgi:chromosome segregation ATPase
MPFEAAETRVTELREQVDTLRARAKKAAASARATLGTEIQSEAAEWDEWYRDLDRGLSEVADVLEETEAEARREVVADTKAAGRKIDRSLDALDGRLSRFDDQVTAKEDAVIAHGRASYESARNALQ